MPLMLTDPDLDIWVPLPMDEVTAEALLIQLQRLANDEAIGELGIKIANVFQWVIEECIDPDLQYPTPRQLRYAQTIARALKITVPLEAQRFRGSMHAFLNTHVPLFAAHRAAQAKRRKPAKPD